MAVITVQGAPCVSKRVAILGEWRNRCDRKAVDRLMSFPSRAAGVGHPEEPFPLVVGSKEISSQYRRPTGVALGLKVKCGFIPPSPANRACNLLSKDDWRLSLADEVAKRRPKMAAIALALRAAMSDRSDGIWLTGTASGPDFSIIRPSGHPESKGPSANSGEEVTLPISSKLICSYIFNASVIDITLWNVAGGNELS